ncbi:MAG: phosphoglycerate kinase [Rickettsiales bacterium]|nr:phosphoglycerate kinase [Rickettsiales bacterium]
MPNFTRLKDCVVTNKNVIVRVDINVPMQNGNIEDDTRIRAVIPTLRYLAEQKAKVIVISHFGRPEGEQIRTFPPQTRVESGDKSMSLQPLVARVQELLGSAIKVNFVDDCVGDKPGAAISKAEYGDVIMLENLRFYKQETKNDHAFALDLAGLGDLYVNDAFSCSHRAHASIVGIPSILKACAGFLLEAELDNLTNLLENAKKPMMAVVGGAKVSTKLDLLNSLVFKAQSLVVGGGMANSFLYAMGKNIGKSLCEKDLKPEVLLIIEKAKQAGCAILLPSDVVVTKKFEENAVCRTVLVDDVQDDEIIADIGLVSISDLSEALKKHQTLLWNGPLGAFEIKPFNLGTEGFAKVAASLTKEGKLLSIAGGGDVVSALNSSGLANDFTYISTAGGAFLEWLEGKELPGVIALNNKK